jgi:phospho-N-acetylmuramoyl-pentapeptide-transferase
LTALFISFALGPSLIRWLKSRQPHGQPIRADGPESHLLTKKGTPTMGGSLILIALAASTLLWADLGNGYVWVVLFVTMGFGLVGFGDDYLKLTRRNHRGLPGRLKLAAQILVSLIGTYWIMQLTRDPLSTQLAVPFLKNVLIDLGWMFLPFGVLVMAGASNAVNLTDGLDGLAIVPVMIAAGCFALITYLAGNAIFANYLQIHHIPGSGELTVFCGALVGASRLPVVQRAAGDGLHGRHRLAVGRRRAGHHERHRQARDRADHDRRAVRTGDGVGHRQVVSYRLTGKRVFG